MRGRHAVEERAVVRDDDQRRASQQQVLEQRDGVDVEVVGRLVEQQQVGRQREGERERGALGLAPGQLRRILRLVEPEAMQVLDESRFDAPAVAFVGEAFQAAAQREALAQRRRRRDVRLLFDERHGQAVALLQIAVVERDPPRDHVQQRALAGAVAPDQPDAVALEQRQAGAVEQRMQAEGEFGVEQGGERHGRIVARRGNGDRPAGIRQFMR